MIITTVKKKLKADLIQYVDIKSKEIKPLIDISTFTKEQREIWELARTDCLLRHSFVHLALKEGWTAEEAKQAVDTVIAAIPDHDPEQYEKKLDGLLAYCERGTT